MKLWCWLGFHAWLKRGGTRVREGLHRKCLRCGKEQEGFEFGIPEFKTTWLWLKNVPPLRPTQLLDPPKRGTKKHDEWSVVHRAAPGPERSRNAAAPIQRSRRRWWSNGQHENISRT